MMDKQCEAFLMGLGENADFEVSDALNKVLRDGLGRVVPVPATTICKNQTDEDRDEDQFVAEDIHEAIKRVDQLLNQSLISHAN
jgi:hypothetical protein